MLNPWRAFGKAISKFVLTPQVVFRSHKLLLTTYLFGLNLPMNWFSLRKDTVHVKFKLTSMSSSPGWQHF